MPQVLVFKALGLIAGGLCSAILLRACLNDDSCRDSRDEDPEDEEESEAFLVKRKGGNKSTQSCSPERHEMGRGMENKRQLTGTAVAEQTSAEQKVPNRTKHSSEQKDAVGFSGKGCSHEACSDIRKDQKHLPGQNFAEAGGDNEQKDSESERASGEESASEEQGDEAKRNCEILRELGKKMGSGEFEAASDLRDMLIPEKQVCKITAAPDSRESQGKPAKSLKKQPSWLGRLWAPSVNAPVTSGSSSADEEAGDIHTIEDGEWETVQRQSLTDADLMASMIFVEGMEELSGAERTQREAESEMSGKEGNAPIASVSLRPRKEAETEKKKGAEKERNAQDPADMWASLVLVNPAEEEGGDTQSAFQGEESPADGNEKESNMEGSILPVSRAPSE